MTEITESQKLGAIVLLIGFLMMVAGVWLWLGSFAALAMVGAAMTWFGWSLV